MEIERRFGWIDGWLEFQWTNCHLMFGFNLLEWGIGFKITPEPRRFYCLSLQVLCFDAHLQFWRHSTVKGDQ